MAKIKKTNRSQFPQGRFVPIPHAILDSKAYQSSSATAKSLLFEIARQHDGKNNGRLHCSTTWLRSRGWPSNGTIDRAKRQLIEHKLIIETRKGGLNQGVSCYALTWLDIHDYRGLDIGVGAYRRGLWAEMESLPIPCQRDRHSRNEVSAVPANGNVEVASVPDAGTKTAESGDAPVPAGGNNECLPSARLWRVPVVGKKGASGTKSTGRRPASEQSSSVVTEPEECIV